MGPDQAPPKKRALGRLLVASLVAPIAAGAIFGLCVLLGVFPQETISLPPVSPTSVAYGIIVGVGIGVAFGIPAFALLGIPIHMFLVRSGRRMLATYALAGIVVGSTFSAVAWGYYLTPRAHLRQLGWAVETTLADLLLAPCAFATTFMLFWLIRRPDRDAANPSNDAP